MNNDGKKFKKQLNATKIMQIGSINKEKAHIINMIIVELLAVAILLPLFVSAVYAGSAVAVSCALVLTTSEAFTLKKNISTLIGLHKLSKEINNLIDMGFALQDVLEGKTTSLEKTNNKENLDADESKHIASLNKTKHKDASNESSVKNAKKLKKYFDKKQKKQAKELQQEDDTTYVVFR